MDMKCREDSESEALGYRSDNHQTKSILIVDDVDINRKILKTFLERRGLLTREADNGVEALLHLNDEAYKPDFVFMDIQMPAMDGMEATARIRDMGYRNPIIGITANVTGDVKDRCIAAGMDIVIFKPYQFDEILELIEA